MPATAEIPVIAEIPVDALTAVMNSLPRINCPNPVKFVADQAKPEEGVTVKPGSFFVLN